MTMMVRPYRFITITDPFFANTINLVSGEGTNATDANEPDLSFAAHGNGSSVGSGSPDAQYSTTTMVSGSSSVRFDTGRNDGVRWTDHADYTIGTGNFTIEGFFNHDANTVNETLVGHYNATGNQRGWVFSYRGDLATDVLDFTASSVAQAGAAATSIITGTWTPTVATWYYYCVERSGTTIRIYAGVPGGTASMLNKVTSGVDIYNCTAGLRYGTTDGEANGFNGYMDERRITLAARYATDAGYPVPAAPFPRS